MRIAVTFSSSNQRFSAQFRSNEHTLDVDFHESITVVPPAISGDYPLYAGAYVVTPKAMEQQVLPTERTVLLNDITVKKVPLYQTSNNSGGNTVYIATEVI